MKTSVCLREKKKAVRHRPVAQILSVSARAIPDVLCVLGHFWRLFLRGQLHARDRHGRNL